MIADGLYSVEQKIKDSVSSRQEQSNDASVLLVAVTKNHDVNAMREAIDAGVTDVGENRIQEAKEKYDILGRTVRWHLIGHLQTNKVKQAVKMFDMIHSVDSIHLLQAINKAAGNIDKIQDILIQVNLAQEDSKSGIYEADLPQLLSAADELSHIRLCGLMCIAPNYEDVEQCRPLFAKMYKIFKIIQEKPFKTANIKYLSMGMSHDYQIAIEEGANIVRVGTAIFGKRQY